MLYTYYCKNCKEEIESLKERKRCGKCRQSLLDTRDTAKALDVEPIVEDTSYFINPMANPKPRGDSKVPCKQLPLEIKTNFVDYSNEYKDETKEERQKAKKQGKFVVSPRRPVAEKLAIRCTECNTIDKVSPALANPSYKCERCLQKLMRV
jgi:hypothetical protein